MSKVGILTLYYKNYNYGGLLQAYALQHSIQNSQQISYILESGYDGWRPIKEVIKKPIRKVYYKIKFGHKWAENVWQRKQMFDSFSEKIPHTKVVTAESICSLSDDFEVFVCGSDQIWNPVGWQPQFFLSFLPENKKRVSYAASIARESLSTEEIKFVERYIDKFFAISVRENQAEKILCNAFPEKKIQTVCDPVFLLEMSEWKDLSKKSKIKIEEKFIFAYFLGNNKEFRYKALEYAKKLGIKIIFVGYMNKDDFQWEKENLQYIAPPMGPIEFLWAIDNAELVLTDSFHAAAFSCILEKPFYVLPRFKKGEKGSMNSRLEHLVSMYGIEERFTNNLESLEFAYDNRELISIREKIKEQRRIGLSFLAENVL